MEIAEYPSDQPLDPFFDALRRRHPGVDVVVLPAEPPVRERADDEQ